MIITPNDRLVLLFFLCILTSASLAAEMSVATEISAASSVVSATPADAGGNPALPNAGLPVVETSPEPVQEGCRPLTYKAMAADVQAFTARSQKIELPGQARLFKEAVSLWSQTIEQCEGKSKEQAQQNLAESQKELISIGEQLGAGAQCATIHKDALTLQDMAKNALSERRWNYAAMLFHKSENMWDMALEECNGSQQIVARNHRDEAAIDGHNAKSCAPLFEKAREYTLKLRSSGATLGIEEKQNSSMVAETLWREAVIQCKGEKVQDSARNNAQTLARERGTPWIARAAPDDVPNTPETVQPVTAAQRSVASEIIQPVKVPLAASVTAAVAIQNPVPAKITMPVVAIPAPVVVMPGQKTAAPLIEFSAENAEKLNVYSGVAKVTWANGDVFQGDLLMGKRHGKGSFIWANGQRYEGDWAQDEAIGQGVLKFPEGDEYEGEVVNGVPQGQGRMRYTSGDTYTGNFNAGEPDKRGVYLWKNGQQLDGEWKNGSCNGQGRTLFVSGDSYTGNYVNGLSDGMGEFDWANGDKYIGLWRAGKMHGQGKFIWKSGNQWEGMYENGKQTDQGKTTLVNFDLPFVKSP